MIDMLKNSGVLQTMNWTGIATKRFAFPNQVDDSVMRDETGFIIPGVASNPFSYINELRNLLFEFTKNKEPGKIREYPRLNQSSLLREWNAQTVPLKPEVARMNAALRPAFLASHDKMANFHPVGLSRENIGSNAGLGKVFRKFYIDRGMNVVGGCNRYAIFSVDVNIYDRILKVPHHEMHDRAHSTLPRFATTEATAAENFASSPPSTSHHGTTSSMGWSSSGRNGRIRSSPRCTTSCIPRTNSLSSTSRPKNHSCT